MGQTEWHRHKEHHLKKGGELDPGRHTSRCYRMQRRERTLGQVSEAVVFALSLKDG